MQKTRMDDGKLKIKFTDGCNVIVSVRGEKLLHEICEIRGVKEDKIFNWGHDLLHLLKSKNGLFIIKRQHGELVFTTITALETRVEIERAKT